MSQTDCWKNCGTANLCDKSVNYSWRKIANLRNKKVHACCFPPLRKVHPWWKQRDNQFSVLFLKTRYSIVLPINHYWITLTRNSLSYKNSVESRLKSWWFIINCIPSSKLFVRSLMHVCVFLSISVSKVWTFISNRNPRKNAKLIATLYGCYF